MAKRQRVRPKSRRAGQSRGGIGVIKVSVVVSREVGATGAKAFFACARVGRKGPLRSGDCATGKNPRAAMAKALAKLARGVSKRKGAFQGLRRR